MDEVKKYLGRNNDIIAQIGASLNEAKQYDLDKILGKSRQAEYSFIDLKPLIEQVIATIDLLVLRGLQGMPRHYLDSINDIFPDLSNHITNFTSYKHTENQAIQTRVNRINAFTSAHEGWINKLAPPLIYTAAAVDFGQKMLDGAGEALAKIEDREKDFNTKVDGIEAQAQLVLQTIRDQSANMAVDATRTEFDIAANMHSQAADNWLKVSVAAFAAALLVMIVSWILAYTKTPDTPQAAISVVAAKLVTISTLIYAVVWCGRNYRAHKHNQTLNEHRRNALATFRAFVEGSDSEEVRDAILLQAAQAAFTPRPTSYDSAETDQHPLNQVVEITKAAR